MELSKKLNEKSVKLFTSMKQQFVYVTNRHSETPMAWVETATVAETDCETSLVFTRFQNAYCN